jgi:hypothetical protein
MLLMGKKPEDWPLFPDPPVEMGELVGCAHGIVDGWNYPAPVYSGADGQLWRSDDRGWFAIEEPRLRYLVVTKHEPSLTPGGLMIARDQIAEYEAAPDAYARKAQIELAQGDQNTITIHNDSGAEQPKPKSDSTTGGDLWGNKWPS